MHMTVKELIERLKKLPADKEVKVFDNCFNEQININRLDEKESVVLIDINW